MKNTTSLLQVRIPESQKLLAQKKLEAVGLTIPDFLRISILQFNQSGKISLQAPIDDEDKIDLIRGSASKVNELDWVESDGTNYTQIKPLTD